MPWTREKNILRHYLFGDKIIRECLRIDTTHNYDNDSLKSRNSEKIACPGSW